MSWSRYFRRGDWDSERAREIEAYLEIETADNVARGMPLAQARSAARRKLGNPTCVREEIYRMNSITFLETLWQDLKYALRLLRKTPGFTLVAVLSLALGIGANTAVFTVVHAVLLRPLPYPEPDRLVRVQQGTNQGDVSMPEYEFSNKHASSFVSAAGYRWASDRSLGYRGRRDSAKTLPITADFFRTLGIVPALGREFTPEETRRGGPQAIILTDSLWRRTFDADPEVLGRIVTLDGGGSYTIAGVLPRGFWFHREADAFVPLRLTGSLDDMGINTRMIARLKPGVSLRQAATEMPTLTEGIRSTLLPELARDYRGLTVTSYRDSIVGDVRTVLLLLFGAVVLLLSIACTNLASLLLARLAARQKEIALRMALGSGRGRLLRQFFIENAVLALAGALTGFLGAGAFVKVFVALMPLDLPSSTSIQPDVTVLAFTLAIAFGTALAFSLAPALATSRTDLQETLKAGGRLAGSGTTRHRTRNLLVVSEVALSVTLLVAAALLIESLFNLHRQPLGFTTKGVFTFSTPVEPERRGRPAALREFESALMERLRSVPGVHGVAGIHVLPLTNQHNFPAERVGDPEHSIGNMEVRFVTPGYFDVMGIPVVRGRPLQNTDTATSQPVILVNETVARRWWPQGNPIGDLVKLGRFRGRDLPQIKDAPREVVGIVRDTKTVNLKEPPRPTVYVTVAQIGFEQGLNWVLRADLTTGLATQLRQAIADVDPRQRVQRMRPMEEILTATTADSRWNAWLFGIFAGLALVLTAIGVFGLLSFSVARRINEFGTRIALGATRQDVLKLVLRQGMALVAVGLVLGLGGALALTRYLSTLLFGVRATDPLTFAGVAVVLLGVGMMAGYVPARRATKVDPVVALRCE